MRLASMGLGLVHAGLGLVRAGLGTGACWTGTGACWTATGALDLPRTGARSTSILHFLYVHATLLVSGVIFEGLPSPGSLP